MELKRSIFVFLLISIYELTTNAKVYNECELARELAIRGFSKSSLPDWVCLIKSESNMNTRARNLLNKKGSEAFGLFMINNSDYCKSTNRDSKNICNLNCMRTYKYLRIFNRFHCTFLFRSFSWRYTNSWSEMRSNYFQTARICCLERMEPKLQKKTIALFGPLLFGVWL